MSIICGYYLWIHWYFLFIPYFLLSLYWTCPTKLFWKWIFFIPFHFSSLFCHNIIIEDYTIKLLLLFFLFRCSSNFSSILSLSFVVLDGVFCVKIFFVIFETSILFRVYNFSLDKLLLFCVLRPVVSVYTTTYYQFIIYFLLTISWLICSYFLTKHIWFLYYTLEVDERGLDTFFCLFSNICRY